MSEKFTEQDAAVLITIARRAPLQNMDEAANVSKLLDRFTTFFETSLQPVEDNVTEIGSAD